MLKKNPSSEEQNASFYEISMQASLNDVDSRFIKLGPPDYM